MSRTATAILSLAIVVLAIIAAVLLFSLRPAPDQREPPQSAMLVDAVEAQIARGSFEVSSQGTLQPSTETELVSEVSGRIIHLSDQFVAGGFFRAGEVLARIDPSDYETALLRAEAGLASARARLADESARSEQARRDWQRLHGSDREPGDLVARIPQLRDAEAGVQAAEADVQRARRELERTRIRLPYDGLIKERAADLGQFVSPGTALGIAFAVATAEVRLPLSDRDMAFLDLPRPGYAPENPAPVILHGNVAGRAGTWQAQLVRTEGRVEESSRLTYAVAEIQDPYGLLGDNHARPLPIGTFVNARIQGRSAAGLIRLPRVALRDNNQLYIADDQDRLALRQVEVVRSTPEHVYVVNDLVPGERVITTAIPAPVPGLALQVREVPAAEVPEDEPVLRILPADGYAADRDDES